MSLRKIIMYLKAAVPSYQKGGLVMQSKTLKISNGALRGITSKAKIYCFPLLSVRRTQHSWHSWGKHLNYRKLPEKIQVLVQLLSPKMSRTFPPVKLAQASLHHLVRYSQTRKNKGAKSHLHLLRLQ